MAFVLIQHLDSSQKSFLADVLSKATNMVVTQAIDGELIEPNHVYVIPPEADLAIVKDSLALLPRTEDRKLHLPVDFFLRSLAEARGPRAIGVILSGTASDGTDGLKAIKGADGITFAQSPNSAKFDGMPRSAVDAGVVDFVLPIAELARELVLLSKHPYIAANAAWPPPKVDDSTLEEVIAIIRKVRGVNFGEYKTPTFQRRLARRMALRKVEKLSDYVELLRGDKVEVECLYEDIFIHVTSFFRDPDVFNSLKKNVFPEIIKRKSAGEPIRLWVAGCSSGEEVYSLVIALLESLGDYTEKHPIQIFGSDISEKSIDKARAGAYPETALVDVSDERRRRYFTKIDNGFRINKSVRDLCVFVRHDLAKDPPFSKLDLVSCRNVLIYFDQGLQKRVLPTFHYSLNQGGFLLLGHSESIAGFSQLFTAVDKTNKVFTRTMAVSALQFTPRAEVHPAAVLAKRAPTDPPPVRCCCG